MYVRTKVEILNGRGIGFNVLDNLLFHAIFDVEKDIVNTHTLRYVDFK